MSEYITNKVFKLRDAATMNPTQTTTASVAQLDDVIKDIRTLEAQVKAAQGLVKAGADLDRLAQMIVNSPPERGIKGEIESFAFDASHGWIVALAAARKAGIQ